MTKGDAISNRDSWKSTKQDYENKIQRIQTVKTNYMNNLDSGEWANLWADFYNFKVDVNPSFQAVDWEGKRVSEYREKLEHVMSSLTLEGNKHYDVITQFEEQMQKYQIKVQDAQEQITYWQSVIDNWQEEEEE